MDSLDVALYENQGLKFAVLSVADSIIDDRNAVDNLVAEGVIRFNCPVVLVDAHRNRKHGREELVSFLSYVNLGSLPWRRMDWSN